MTNKNISDLPDNDLIDNVLQSLHYQKRVNAAARAALASTVQNEDGK